MMCLLVKRDFDVTVLLAVVAVAFVVVEALAAVVEQQQQSPCPSVDSHASATAAGSSSLVQSHP